MLSWNVLVMSSLLYSATLFGVAFWAERRAARGQLGWLRSPLIYTLSLSVYCTGWTFYGAVGSAARGGLEFLTIYLGPTLVMLGWWVVLRRLVRVGRAERATSIADLISSRYGKSGTLAVMVTLLAVLGTTPYIALQLQSLTVSFLTLAPILAAREGASADVAFWIASGLTLFTILFGTRTLDVDEQHPGVVTAIALEAVVKLMALLAVGVVMVWSVGGGLTAVFALPPAPALLEGSIWSHRWATLTFLSASAIICLPRMFQVLVVENSDERHLATASWAFPLYLFLICLFVLPIAILGRHLLPDGNPDLYILTLPIHTEHETLALIVFIGGFSAATSMVIVAAIALSTMVSNHIALPLWLWWRRRKGLGDGNLRRIALGSRRLSIGLILALGYLYYLLTGGTDALAAIGLIAFCGLAQILPSLLGGLFWRGATRAGAVAGIGIGFAIWVYTLFLPSVGGSALFSPTLLAEGPFGLAALRPQALFGVAGPDPLVHTLFWSMAFNMGTFLLVSLLTAPEPLERMQAARFVAARGAAAPGMVYRTARSATADELFALAARILSAARARALFSEAAAAQGRADGRPEVTEALIAAVERALAGSIGAASAHAMVSQVTRGGEISVEELIRMADETAQIVEYSHRLEAQSRELANSAAQLRRANRRLQELSEQKDAFLSQVSHELRTPMTAIRSFADILRETPDLAPDDATRFAGIICSEAERLTRLLDEILDLSVLESGPAEWPLGPIRLGDAVERAVASTEGIRRPKGVALRVLPEGMDWVVEAELDRLSQVIINLISNAVKYGMADAPEITLQAGRDGGTIWLKVADNGPGIPEEARDRVFEKFSRLSKATLAGSAGLGLPISREIMKNLGGDLQLLPGPGGAVFRLSLKAADAPALQVGE